MTPTKTTSPCDFVGPAQLATREELHAIHQHIEELVDLCEAMLAALEDIHETLQRGPRR